MLYKRRPLFPKVLELSETHFKQIFQRILLGVISSIGGRVTIQQPFGHIDPAFEMSIGFLQAFFVDENGVTTELLHFMRAQFLPNARLRQVLDRLLRIGHAEQLAVGIAARRNGRTDEGGISAWNFSQVILSKGVPQHFNRVHESVEILRCFEFALFLLAVERLDDLAPDIRRLLHIGEIHGVFVHQVNSEVVGQGVPGLFGKVQPFGNSQFVFGHDLEGDGLRRVAP